MGGGSERGGSERGGVVEQWEGRGGECAHQRGGARQQRERPRMQQLPLLKGGASSPDPAAVMACRHFLSCTSPAAKTPVRTVGASRGQGGHAPCVSTLRGRGAQPMLAPTTPPAPHTAGDAHPPPRWLCCLAWWQCSRPRPAPAVHGGEGERWGERGGEVGVWARGVGGVMQPPSPASPPPTPCSPGRPETWWRARGRWQRRGRPARRR